MAGASELTDHSQHPNCRILGSTTWSGIHGLELLYKICCTKVVVESDCLELVEARNGKIEIWSPYAAVLADCLHLAHVYQRFHLGIVPGKQMVWHISLLGIVMILKLVMIG